MTSPVNVALSLRSMADLQPHRPAVIFPHGRDNANRVAYTHLTFRQLHEDSDCIAHGLQQIGVHRGLRTAVMVTPSLDFFALVFAMFKVGAVPVLIDPGMGIHNLGRCLTEAEPSAFIGIPKAQLARRVLRWGRRTIRIRVSVGSKWLGGQWSLDELRKVVPSMHFAAEFHLRLLVEHAPTHLEWHQR